jgi:shikimate kinase
MKSESIVLIGMAGVGKSTIGVSLSEALAFDFIDVDNYIVEKDGKTAHEIIDSEGEESFLQIEKRRMYEIDLAHRVVAPGGSIIYHSDLMEYLKECSTLVFLDDSFEDIEGRLPSLSARGIVGLKNKSLREIYDERRPLYIKYADIAIKCQGKSQDKLAREILQHFLAFRE